MDYSILLAPQSTLFLVPPLFSIECLSNRLVPLLALYAPEVLVALAH